MIAVHPDFVIALLLGFVKNELQPPVQMGDLDIVYVFFVAVAGVTHVTNYISCGHNAAFLQFFVIGEILSQMCIIIVALFIKAADSDAPAAVTIPAKRLDIARFYGNDWRTDVNIKLNYL